MRSSSPEYDELVLTDRSNEDQDEEEFSKVIPVKAELRQPPDHGVSSKDDDAVIFDDSESDEFSLPQVDWSCIASMSPIQNTDEVLPPVCDKAGTNATGPQVVNHCEVANPLMTLNSQNVEQSKDYEEDVSAGDTNISEGLIFNLGSVGHEGAGTPVMHEGSETVGESPVHSISRLSRKRSRVSRDACEEQIQCKRLHCNVDDVLTDSSYAVAEAALPRPFQHDTGSDGAAVLPSCDNFLSQSCSDSNSLSQSTSHAAETTVVRSGSCTPNVFSQDTDASFSQGTQ